MYKTIAKPDYALEDHYFDGVLGAIAQDDWQLVVMQQGPSSLPANADFLRTWTMKLDTAITDAGARSALYQVWPSSQFMGSFTAVRESYRNAAIAVDGMFIPAGEAWVKAWEADPALDLYGPDGFHPSATGVYLAALVHFEMLYGRSALDLPKEAVVAGLKLNLSRAQVMRLQTAAHETAVAWGIP